jgi:hypothetical protein
MPSTVPTSTEFNDQVLRINVLEDGLKKLGDRVTKLETTPPPTPTALLSDTFDSTYILAGGATSPDSKWKAVYTGGGKIESANGVFHEYPQTSTDATGKETHACLTISTQQFDNFKLEFDMRTNKQLRQNFTPKNWETAWIMFRYFDAIHHYYFTLKKTGCEFGKKDNVEGDPALEKQIFLPMLVQKSVTIGTFQHIIITAKDFAFTITVDGTKVVDFTDTPQNAPKMAKGSLGLYCEDSDVSWDNIKLTAL